MKIILQKIIASSGYASRRGAEQLIRQGLVQINGQLAQIGEQADPQIDAITIKGRLLGDQAKKIYLKLNKPQDYVCTNRLFPGEKNIFSLINIKERLFTVGRLDKDSRGLVLLTNDGSLTQRLSHPKFQQEKVYEVKIKESSKKETGLDETKRNNHIITHFLRGVDIGEEDSLARAKKIQCLQNNLFIITLNEGKKRQIRRMFKALDFEVVDLKRINLAGLELGNLAEGQWAYLTEAELNKLKI